MRLGLTAMFYAFVLVYCMGQQQLSGFDKSEKRNFSKIERHIRKNGGNLSTLDSIVNNISSIATSDLEKTYASFYWVSYFLTYDMLSFKANKIVPYSPHEVLRSKLAVCNGYAFLFQAICTRLRLDTEVINGYSKGYGYKAGESFTISNHSWNAVRLNDKWFFVDATWASPNNNTSISPHFSTVDNSYFLPNPKEFVINHLPEDPSWQLLSPIVPLEVFEIAIDEVRSQTKFSLVINEKKQKYTFYNDVAQREVALRQRISDFNPKNKSAEYYLGVAILYQALDDLEKLHLLNHASLHIELPKYKYRIYDLLGQAAFHFKGALTSNEKEIRISAKTFLEEIGYQKGVFNYEAAQSIYDSTIDFEIAEALLIQEKFNLMINQYLDIAIFYFELVDPQSWYHEHATSYIQVINSTRSDLLIK